MARTPLARDTYNMIPPMAMDRRSRTRLPNPPCPTCRADSEQVRVTTRTSARLYFKCGECGGVWDGEVPARWAAKRHRSPYSGR